MENKEMNIGAFFPQLNEEEILKLGAGDEPEARNIFYTPPAATSIHAISVRIKLVLWTQHEIANRHTGQNESSLVGRVSSDQFALNFEVGAYSSVGSATGTVYGVST